MTKRIFKLHQLPLFIHFIVVLILEVLFVKRTSVGKRCVCGIEVIGRTGHIEVI
jgi:hypothetical protein